MSAPNRILTSTEIRRSFLDFFHAQRHTIVPSASLLPDSPNLLFTNAGMNQFVPIFLGQRAADLSRWPGALAGSDTRAADTQKCVRAGGKHNDLDDVGLDTYHHTFFEMLGNWSFGDYFKKEAIGWAWDLLTNVWGLPPARLYATVYRPDPARGDPSDFDQEAHDLWAEKFAALGLDPGRHIVNGNKKDNFWMMGETGPCGPCSEVHIDLTVDGDTRGALVNRGDSRCMEIWNLVFIQFNANPDGTFSLLPARHVDTGMGFERVTSIIQNTRGLTDFTGVISNYETDVFRPIFDRLEELSGKRYASTLPAPGSDGASEQERLDIAFRVIADHLRTIAFAVADGIQPGNTDRHYVIRRILRRAVRYGRRLGFQRPFLHRLTGVLAGSMGDVFPEIRTRQAKVEEVIAQEEEAFNRTLDRGLDLFQEEADRLEREAPAAGAVRQLPGSFAFKLYDTFGFPVDLTEILARENGLAVDRPAFERLMEEQRARARAAQKREIITVSNLDPTLPATRFAGFDQLALETRILEVVKSGDSLAVILEESPCYAEMGGQVGDTGELTAGGRLWRIAGTRKTGSVFLHLIEGSEGPEPGLAVHVAVENARRAAIQRHHTATHLLHWALHEVVNREASQKGSFVGPEKLTFDFNGTALTPGQLSDLERLVNERIQENALVTWREVPYAEVKGRPEVMQFFGDKYGEMVRVVQIGGQAEALDGYSMELCGGTHTRATGEIGAFKIAAEYATAAGIRRIEALAGIEAWQYQAGRDARLREACLLVNCEVDLLPARITQLFEQRSILEKEIRALREKESAALATRLAAQAVTGKGVPVVAAVIEIASPEEMRSLASQVVKHLGEGVVILLAAFGEKSNAVAAASPAAVKAGWAAGTIIRELSAQLGGKGGGKPDFAMGGGKNTGQLAEILQAWRNTAEL